MPGSTRGRCTLHVFSWTPTQMDIQSVEGDTLSSLLLLCSVYGQACTALHRPPGDPHEEVDLFPHMYGAVNWLLDTLLGEVGS